MDKYINAGKLAEQFRDMAEFAEEGAAVALREAADAVDDMPGEDVRAEVVFQWDVVIGYSRFLRCPICGFETASDRQPKAECWKHCPGCGNKISGGGMMARDRKKSKENKKLGKDPVSFRNAEGYADPVPYEVLKREEEKGRGGRRNTERV